MHKSRSGFFAPLCIITLALTITGCVATVAAQEAVQSSASSGLQVTAFAAHSTTSWDVRDPGQQKFELPVLYLHRAREATAAADRTLAIQLSGLEAATEIQIEAVSLHQDVSTSQSYRTTYSTVTPDHPCTAEAPCTIRWTFDAATPSDLYRLRLKDQTGQTLWENPYSDRPDFAMLDTWDVNLGAFIARVVYATLFPFARGHNDLANRLPPDRVPTFIAELFVPIIADTWQTQFVAWGFGETVHPDWDDDNLLEVVVTDPPFALFDGTGTYTRFTGDDGLPYPQRRIWWFASNNAFQAYDTLENAYKAVFAHEFFHTMQWNILLGAGQPTNLWISWIEAQGRFAPAVQYPELELSRTHLVAENSAYASGANRFLATHLNTSYGELEANEGNKYDAALYWRFLYEQYNDMAIVRAALEEMTRHQEMAYHYSPDTVNVMGRAMDAAFARVDGPFRRFEESLVAFARANYALRLEHGRCATVEPASCGGMHYDPESVYVDPPLEAGLDYDGAPLSYSGAIPASYGTDLIEVRLEYGRYDRPLRIKFEGDGGAARFKVQIWKLAPGRSKPQAVTPQPEVVVQEASGAHGYVIPRLNWTETNRLALIITRVDPDEGVDAVGGYQITVE